MRIAGCIAAALIDKLRASGARFYRDRRGSAAIIMAIAALPLLAAVGIGIDTARGYMVRGRLSQALDAAALAGGHVTAGANRDADIAMYFWANFPQGYLGANVSLSTPIVNADGTVTVNGTAVLPTTFTRLFNVISPAGVQWDTITVNATTTMLRSSRGIELAMVLDNTYSMNTNNKMTALKNAAYGLLDELYGTSDTIPKLYVSVVPFVSMVNVGNQHSSWAPTVVPTQYTVSSLVRTSGTANAGTGGSSSNPSTYNACATTSVNHPFRDGQLIDISGASQSYYNGRVQVRTSNWPSGCTAGATKFWYVIDNGTGSTPVTPATGTIHAQVPPITFNTGTYTQSNGVWRGCVEARTASNGLYEIGQADASPTTASFKKAFWPSTATVKFYDSNKRLRANSASSNTWFDNDWTAFSSINEDGGVGDSGSYGPNKGCPAVPIAPLQQSKAAVRAVIGQMSPWWGGGTNIPAGLAWGWRTLSPNYRNLWGAPSTAELPLDYNTDKMDKVVILLSDGMNQLVAQNGAPGCDGSQGAYGGSYSCTPYETEYTAFGRLTEGLMHDLDASPSVPVATTTTQATDALNSRVKSICAAMKQPNVNITIYTIILQENDPTITQIFRDCASKPENFFAAPSASDLAGIFQVIGQKLSELRLSK